MVKVLAQFAYLQANVCRKVLVNVPHLLERRVWFDEFESPADSLFSRFVLCGGSSDDE